MISTTASSAFASLPYPYSTPVGTLSSRLKELTQPVAAFFCQNAARDLHLMIELRMIQHVQNASRSPCFRIQGTEDQSPDPGMNHGSRAH